MVNENHNPNGYSYQDAHVLSRLDSYNFVIDVPTDNGQRVKLAITSCGDLMPTNEIQAGVNLKWIGYDEDRVHHCDELDGPHNGYTLERDTHGIPIRHNYAAELPGSWTSWDASTTASARP